MSQTPPDEANLSRAELQVKVHALQDQLTAAAEQRAGKDAKIRDLEQALVGCHDRLNNQEAALKHLQQENQCLKEGFMDEDEETALLTPADQGTLAWIRVNGPALEAMVKWWANWQTMETTKPPTLVRELEKKEGVSMYAKDSTPSEKLVEQMRDDITEIVLQLNRGFADPNSKELDRVWRNLSTLAMRLLSYERGLGQSHETAGL